MKTNSIISEQGTVLITALLTITIMTLICATSLYITSQNTNAGMQTASWQQALTGAESGVDAAIRALNDNGQTGAWTNWVQMSQSGTTLPTIEPTPSATPSPTGAPDSSHYNLLPSSKLSVSFPNTEGPTSISTWVTVDQGGMAASQDTNGQQWYRIRASGQANLSGPPRVSNNRLDNDLRNTIALRFNRKTGNTTNLGPSRTIEVIMQPLSSGGWGRAITLKSWISMSGSGVVDSYDSGSASKSNWQGTYGIYDSTKRQSHGDIGTLNTAGSSDLRSTYVYGSLSYSGAAVKNTTHVQGAISTPFSVTIPPQYAPTWAAGSYTSYAGGGSNPPNGGNFYAQHSGTPTYIKVNGDLVISSSGNPLHIVQHDSSGLEQVYIWVTGKFTTQGSGYVNQDSGVQVTYYVGDDITISGTSYQNHTGLAANLSINGYGNDKLTVSGSADFVGTFNVPNYDTTISGGGSVAGALISNTLTISGGSGLHYDEALGRGGPSPTIGNYAFASWFEDNSDPTRKDVNGNYIVY